MYLVVQEKFIPVKIKKERFDTRKVKEKDRIT